MGARSDWRYIAQRLNGDGTATYLDLEVPLSDVSIEDALSAPGGLTGTISPEYPRLIGEDGQPILREWHTAIFAESEGEIRGGGILTHSDFSGSKWQVECTGFTGYLKDMPYTGNGASFVNTDTLDIVRSIFHHVQSQDGGNLGLVLDQRKSNVRVGSELASEEYDPEGGPGGLTLQSQAYKLQWYQDFDLLSNVDGLAQDTPFDYHERHYWDGDNIAHRLEFGVPSIGRKRDDLRFAIGENVYIKPEVSNTGAEYADEVYALGAGEGAKMIRGHARRARTRLRRVAVVQDSSMRAKATANSLAAAELAWRSNMEDISTIVVRDHPAARVGSTSVGDTIRLQGKNGWTELDGWYRVLARTIKPTVAGAMELSVVRSDRLST